MTAVMQPAKPRMFYWFFGLWTVVLGYGLVTPWLPEPRIRPGLVFLFWVVLICSAVGCWRLWPRVVRLWVGAVQFRRAEGAPVERLRPPGAPPGLVFLALACTVGFVVTVGTLPFSSTAQLLAGWRERHIALPQQAPAPEDDQLADIYLLPLCGFSREAAAYLAAELRRETGLLVAALPSYDVPGIVRDPRRRQIVIESLQDALTTRIRPLRVPPPPRPHTPLVIGLLEEDAFSRIKDWRFVLSLGFSKVLGVVCTHRLSLDLPVDDDDAQQRLALRTKKLLLRVISFHAFDKIPDSDSRSLTGPTLRSVSDLDHREDTLRFPLRLPAPVR